MPRDPGGDAVPDGAAPDPVQRWPWPASAALVLLAGLLLWTARGPLSAWLDGFSPPPPPPPPAAPPPPPPIAPPPPPPPPPVPLSREQVAERLATIPDQIDALIAAGVDELPTFEGLGTGEGVRAEAIRSRWHAWGTIWRNRVAQIETAIPPAEDCAAHPEHHPTCQALAAVFAQLNAIPDAQTLADARTGLDAVVEAVELVRNPPAEEGEGGGTGEEASS